MYNAISSPYSLARILRNRVQHNPVATAKPIPATRALQEDAEGAGRQVYALERDGDALAAVQALQMDPGPSGSDLGGVGTSVDHDLVRHMGLTGRPATVSASASAETDPRSSGSA